ncbi:MAG: ATPase [Clostridiales Family XIII bacterium]|jgi:sugar (pentulose or hexulose) kinase|nr:ATPase [Clostridiales Family XIII bacterium]
MDKINSNYDIKGFIEGGAACLGIELGSTRVKSVLIGAGYEPVASGGYGWENRYEDGNWTYSLDDVDTAIRASYAALAADVKECYGVELRRVAALGVSAMMHGYLAFDSEGGLLAPFRTWRNTSTGQATEELTELFGFNIPLRWSVAHIYQAILNGESHVKDIASITTLAGYVHRRLTGLGVLGVGDASGMFPIDPATCDYDEGMVDKFDELIAGRGFGWKLGDIMPKVLSAGDGAGELTADGAAWLDPSGALQPGAPACPPEGDAGTGMVATNAVMERTGNISAGTSIFAMIVLERPLSKVYPEIDMVATPTGSPVAMVHCNNCTSDIDAWADVFRSFAKAAGADISDAQLYGAIYGDAANGDPDAGGLIVYNYLSGEPITGFEQGRPLICRAPESRLTFANFARAHLYSTVATLKLGMDILGGENVKVEKIVGHGGLFKTSDTGQRVMAAALDTPVSVMETAGEGGAWGIALLAAYRAELAAAAEAKGAKSASENAGNGKLAFEEFLEEKVFNGMKRSIAEPLPEDASGFREWLEKYKEGLALERTAVKCI